VERTTIAGETEELGENLPQRHFVPPQIPHDQVRFRTPDRTGGKPATNRLSYGAAYLLHLLSDPEHGGGRDLRYVGGLPLAYTALRPKGQNTVFNPVVSWRKIITRIFKLWLKKPNVKQRCMYACTYLG
jgi:hypothetical protein